VGGGGRNGIIAFAIFSLFADDHSWDEKIIWPTTVFSLLEISC
jgi:hypothetical protein